jgi:hypothetical protein
MHSRGAADRLGVCVALLLVASTTRGQTADSIIALNVVARGGPAQLRAVRSERLIGHITLADGSSWVDTVDVERPNRIRTTLWGGGRLLVQASDGHTVWTLNGMAGAPVPHIETGDVARNIQAGADIDGPLIAFRAKGNRVEYAGIDTAAGRPAYVLEVQTATGLHDRYYIDVRTHLQTKWTGIRPSNGDTLVFDSYFGDYRRVDGVMLAFRIDSDTRGRPGRQHMQFDTASVNPPLAPERFRLPH